ncbi:MAG: insulinase family protein [Lachnospiraceae bacterium]|jgi:Zn-dependent M16 (insulinase) family peptidase|nr:insulinase family protein [Lachnospiraceae bacterium]
MKYKNYEILDKQDLKGIKSKGTRLIHKKSGARVVLIENDDKNKVFSIAFRTPAPDSTGVPHIMEHSVLCGSKNFPAKDPFVELVKGSLNTFLNAMTYPDKTVYPIASMNDKDFDNLIHVYMDAVLYPNIYKHEEIFRQEGWSYELNKAEDEIKYNGVVYNEMKGVFSNPDGVLERVIQNSLFPDTTYGNESGGDPENIPDLTYEQFLDFHRTYYHPANSYIYIYGDCNMEEKLAWLDENYLQNFDKKDIDQSISEIEIQTPFANVRELEFPYSVSPEESLDHKTYLSYNKVIGNTLDDKLYLAFQILDYALLQAPGAPIKKALTEAGIGEDISGSYDNGILQPVFSVVSKGANKADKERFIEIITEVLQENVKKGIDKKALKAGLNYNEFLYREADFGNYPKGLMYGLQTLDSWLYDDEKPFVNIEQLDNIEFLKKMVDTDYFENLIKEYLLDNNFGSIVILTPEPGLTLANDEKIARGLKEFKASLSEEEINTLVENTKNLRGYQDKEDSEEDLRKIPLLTREEIGTDIAPIFNEVKDLGENKIIYHHVDTNGIGYLDFIFDVSKISEEEIPYIGILQSVLGVIDTKNYEYGELFNEIHLNTGGITTALEMYRDVHGDIKEYMPTFEVRMKALYPEMKTASSFAIEILKNSKLDDYKRIKEILSMIAVKLNQRFIASGHTTAVTRGMSYISNASRYKELTSGIEFYRFIKSILDDFDNKKEELSSKLVALANKIFAKGNLLISSTNEESFDVEIETACKCLVEELGDGEATNNSEEFLGKGRSLNLNVLNEGFKTESKVQYVAKVGNFLEAGKDYSGALQILKVILNYDYLWVNLRVKGGAYGCMSGFNRLGESYLVSYRDPHLKRTIDVYKGVVEYLKNFSADEREMTKYIIGTISNIDQPLTPEAMGSRSLNLLLNNVTAKDIKQERMEILNAKPKDIQKLAEVLETVVSEDVLCVIGSGEKIQEERELFKEVSSL